MVQPGVTNPELAGEKSLLVSRCGVEQRVLTWLTGRGVHRGDPTQVSLGCTEKERRKLQLRVGDPQK